MTENHLWKNFVYIQKSENIDLKSGKPILYKAMFYFLDYNFCHSVKWEITKIGIKV